MIIALSLFTISAFAANPKANDSPKPYSRPYGMAGCGLGSQAMGKGGGQISAATTNGTSASQYFGITSGTSNCVDNPNDEVASRMDRFINVNRAAIAMDIARGDGDTLASISRLAGCKNSALLGSTLQKNFGEIFPNHKVMPNEITDSIITVIKSDVSLTAACNQVI